MATVDWEQKRREVEDLHALLVTVQRAAEEAGRGSVEALPNGDGIGADFGAARSDLQAAIEGVDSMLAVIADQAAAEPQPSGDAS